MYTFYTPIASSYYSPATQSPIAPIPMPSLSSPVKNDQVFYCYLNLLHCP